MNRSSEYYNNVGEFYDRNCINYELKYWSNGTLQLMRQSFREHLKNQGMRNKKVLEIGIGPGIDLVHFSLIFPDSSFYGIDVSQSMLQHAESKIEQSKCNNIIIRKGSVEDINILFPDVKFDLIYVFFGALNTVKNLEAAMQNLNKVLAPNGKMVLTFVNKYYLAEMFVQLIKMRFKNIFARLKNPWPGYSTKYTVDSQCYSPKEIKRASESYFNILYKQGYSIIYPPWYRNRWIKYLGKRISYLMLKTDHLINKTFAWKLGEYSLFVMQKINK